jgi:hypothetical protein
MNMPKNVDEMQQLWKENMDAGMKSFGAMSKGFQAIAVEFANYSKRIVGGPHGRLQRGSWPPSRWKRRSSAKRIREDGL